MGVNPVRLEPKKLVSARKIVQHSRIRGESIKNLNENFDTSSLALTDSVVGTPQNQNWTGMKKKLGKSKSTNKIVKQDKQFLGKELTTGS